MLVALNAGTDRAWQVDFASPPYAAATIGNDIVFTAGLDGLILGFNMADGVEVFRYQATAGVNAKPLSRVTTSTSRLVVHCCRRQQPSIPACQDALLRSSR